MLIRALLAMQVVTFAPRPDPSDPYRLLPVQGPTLAAIEVRADSVSFFAVPASPEAPVSVYGFSRATRAWTRRGIVGNAAVADHFGLLRRNTFLARWPLPDSDMELVYVTGGQLRPRFEPLADGTSRLIIEERRDSITLAYALLRAPGDTVRIVAAIPDEARTGPISSRVGAVLLEPDTLWLGIVGSLSDAASWRGGLVALDLRTGRTRAYWPPELGPAAINDIVRVRGALWLGTSRGIGILEEDGTWRWLREGDAGLPSGNVEALGSSGDTVWLSTAAGPGGLADGRWFGVQWEPALEGDSVVMVPADRRPEWTQRNAVLRLAWSLRLGEVGRAFVDALESLPRASLDAWRDGDLDLQGLLAQPTLLPFMVQSFARTSVQIGPVHAVVVRRVLESDDAARAVLAQFDDVESPRNSPSARSILYRVLDPAVVLEDARRLVGKGSLTRPEASVAGGALRDFGDERDLPRFFDDWPQNAASAPPGFRWEWVAPIVGRAHPDSLVRVLGSRPVEQRLALIRYMVDEGAVPPRPLAGVCLLARAGFDDSTLDERTRARFGELLAAFGVFDPLPLLIQRDTWDPVRFIDRMRPRSDAFRQLPPGIRGAEARTWVRQWWTLAATAESNDCRNVT